MSDNWGDNQQRVLEKSASYSSLFTPRKKCIYLHLTVNMVSCGVEEMSHGLVFVKRHVNSRSYVVRNLHKTCMFDQV